MQLTQKAARHLTSVSGGSVSGGLLTVARGSVGEQPSVVLVKLEKEEGLRVNRESVGDKTTFSMDHVKNLMLTEKTRIFKVGMFVGADRIAGWVSDPQHARTVVQHGVSRFFLEKFLGCVLKEQPKVTTRKFLNAAQAFINELDDPEKQARYELALLADLNSTDAIIDATNFARRHLDTGDRRPFLDAIRGAALPDGAFPKDLDLIASSIKKLVAEFASGIRVVAPPSAAERMTWKKGKGGMTTLQIDDTLKRVGK